MRKQEQIVFTGHSSGAAVAILATLWALDEDVTPNTNRIPPLCLTFGSPLIGNHIFSHATRREKWSGYFMRFVMKYDILPRILLVPLSSLEQRFDPVLQFFNPKSNPFMDESIANHTVTSDFYFAVMTNAANATSHAACKLMGGTNAVSETLLLFFSAQLSTEAETAQIAYRCLKEHFLYANELRESLAMQNVVYLDQLESHPLSDDGPHGDIAATNMALNDLGIISNICSACYGAKERDCVCGLLESWRNKKIRNEEKIDLGEAKINMLELKDDYKPRNEIQGVSNYEAFKRQDHPRDFEANVSRLKLASVWYGIIEMLRNYELPDEFEVKQEWVELGSQFRRLVEPLDVANYYRHVRNDTTGPYLEGKGRPRRYTQRWLEHQKRKPKGAYSESCLMAEVEEFWIGTRKGISFEEVKKDVLKLEGEIKRWSEEGVLSNDVLLEGSTLVNLWNDLPNQHKEVSCIRRLLLKGN